MIFYLNLISLHTFEIFVVLCFSFNSILCGQRFPDENYDTGSLYDDKYTKINAALEKLEHAPQWVSNWPNPAVKLGQVSGVALDNNGMLLVFHRASNVWDGSTFNERNVYQAIGEPAIPHSTILVFNDTGELVDNWGKNLFFIPHGITVDSKGNVWTTDVALHQVFKFTPDQRHRPALVLGEKFVPGDDDFHFCKPSAVAVLGGGDFFVADGYCNTRIIKYAPDGTKLLQFGRRYGSSPFVLRVPHALALAEAAGAVCAADRERGRVACFRHDNGTFLAGYSSWLLGDRLFSVAYSPAHGGRLYMVNGPSLGADGAGAGGGAVPVRGYVVDYASGRLVRTFAPGGGLRNPHDVAVSPDGARVYVAELDPHRVHKFVDAPAAAAAADSSLAPPAVGNATLDDAAPAHETASVSAVRAETAAVGAGAGAGAEPTAVGAGGGEWWRGAAGGAAGAGGAALLLLAALAALSARDKGRKGITRRRWEYGRGEFKLRRLLERRRFTRVHSDDSEDEPAPMLPPQPPAHA